MTEETIEVVWKYLHLGGNRKYADFETLLHEANAAIAEAKTFREIQVLKYIKDKMNYAMEMSIGYRSISVIIDEKDIEDIEAEIAKDKTRLNGAGKAKAKKPAKKKAKKVAKNRSAKVLGKIVDHGQTARRGNSDIWWGREGMDIIYSPHNEAVRKGDKIPDTYKYADVRYLEDYYGLKAFEFGNWLSQQDRVNYLSGLGLALFDLHKAIGFTPKQISIKGKISVAFGARGRGKANAHFEPGSFAINLTRYSRPDKVKYRPLNFNRVKLIPVDGGAGSFAHEYGHALDYYGGLHVEKGDTFSLSGDDSTHTNPDFALMKKKTLHGLMEKLMCRIIWKNEKATIFTTYYDKLIKRKLKPYFMQRNEIFARAFEVYVNYKLSKKGHRNVFLNHTKYESSIYLTPADMKKLEPDFDALISAIKKHL